ncbi:MAG: SagB family peptide dehydrogenase [Deltaproteobacteria bacterium]|nr:SagB family peptide dehydrogenase [Deltaproteobacteria bacterium]
MTRRRALAFLAAALCAPAALGRPMAGTPSRKGAPVKLPETTIPGKVSVGQAISRRRTVRNFSPTPSLTPAELSTLLWAAQGVTGPGGKRAAPSAGALYPMDVIIIAGKDGVEGLDAGTWRYLPEEHALGPLKQGDLRAAAAGDCLGQSWMARAPASFVITAEYPRITGKYGQRGVRYAIVEAGCISENLFLMAEALNLAAGIIGAFDDHSLAGTLGLAGTGLEPLLVMPVGHEG